MIFPIHYVNLPQNKILIGKTDTILRVTVSSTGYKFLIRDLKNDVKPVIVDISQLKLKKAANLYESAFFSSDFNEEIVKSIKKLKLVSVYPTSINLMFEDAYSKKIPVIPTVNISFQKQYDIYGKAIVIPDSIIVKGTKKDIESIKKVETESLSFSNVCESMFFTAILKKVNGCKDLIYSREYVNIALPVAKYTEADITVAVKPSETNRNVKLVTFPNKVNIIYYIALSDYKKVDTSSFKAVVDSEKAFQNDVDKLKVDIVKCPSFVKILRIVPERVEYIIRK
jgi:hypothetical protein